MRTVLITSAPPPEPLRELIERGSTSVRECRAGDVEGSALDADRLVFWSAPGDEAVRALAEQCAAGRAGRRESVLFVTPEPDPRTGGRLAPDELFVWPRDEDRLKMAFLTGA